MQKLVRRSRHDDDEGKNLGKYKKKPKINVKLKITYAFSWVAL